MLPAMPRRAVNITQTPAGMLACRDSARQEAEAWRSLQQFSNNALELTQKRLQGEADGGAAIAQPTAPAAPWLKRLWFVRR